MSLAAIGHLIQVKVSPDPERAGHLSMYGVMRLNGIDEFVHHGELHADLRPLCSRLPSGRWVTEQGKQALTILWERARSPRASLVLRWDGRLRDRGGR